MKFYNNGPRGLSNKTLRNRNEHKTDRLHCKLVGFVATVSGQALANYVICTLLICNVL
jgi:hypothetical protein